jgi:hypothetical protein
MCDAILNFLLVLLLSSYNNEYLEYLGRTETIIAVLLSV